jgi:hypothetical protein
VESRAYPFRDAAEAVESRAYPFCDAAEAVDSDAQTVPLPG